MKVSESQISDRVAQLYNTYPFPPEPLLDQPPPGYNWRWNWLAAHAFCTGRKPLQENIRILDVGCGTGVGTEYLVHLNPQAEVIGVDLSAAAIDIARERCRRSGADRVEFHHLSLYDIKQIPGQFDLVNCVGVLHHLPDPIRGLQAIAPKLAPSGLMHIFVYAALGRWEISLMQQAIALLQGDRLGTIKTASASDGRPLRLYPNKTDWYSESASAGLWKISETSALLTCMYILKKLTTRLTRYFTSLTLLA